MSPDRLEHRNVLAARRTNKHQKNYLIPVVVKGWQDEQDQLVEKLSNLKEVLFFLEMADLIVLGIELHMEHLLLLSRGGTKCWMLSLFK